MISVVLLNYRRRLALCDVIRSLKPGVSTVGYREVIVVNNSPIKFVPPSVKGLDISVIERGRNYGTESIVEGVKHASNQIIYTQDDDCIPLNKTEIYRTFLAGANHGKMVVNHSDETEGMKPGRLSSTLGNGSFFRAEWAIDFDDKYVAAHQKDLLYCLHWGWFFTGLRGKVNRVNVVIQKNKGNRKYDIERLRNHNVPGRPFYEFGAEALRRTKNYTANLKSCEAIIKNGEKWTVELMK